MSEPWEVSSNVIDGRTVYGVFRIIDPDEPEHSGNREVHNYFKNREDAERIAEAFNRAEAGADEGCPAEEPEEPKEGEIDRIVRLSRLDKVLTESIELNPLNPRKKIDEDKLRELAQSIEEVGFLQPLVITEGSRPDKYLLLAGERRLRAAKMLGLTRVPVNYRSLHFQGTDAKGQMSIMLIENLQREDLDPIEEARAFAALTKEHGWTQTDLAAKIGVSQSHIANRIRLLNLPESAQDAILEGKLTVSAGKELATLAKVPATQKAIDEAIAGEHEPQDLVRAARRHAFENSMSLHEESYPEPKFNTRVCQGCERRVMLPGRYAYDGDSTLCPRCTNIPCWNNMQEQAEAMEAERARQQAIDAGTGDDSNAILNLNELPSGSFERLGQYGVVFDQTNCEECEYNRPAKYTYMDDPVRICLNPACFNAKRTEAQNARRQRVKDLREAHEERVESLISSFYPQGLFDEDDDPDAPDHLAMVYIATQAVIDPPYSSSMSKAKVRAAVFERYGWDEPEGLGWDDEIRHLVGLLENLPASELMRLVFYAMLRPVEHDSVVFGAVYGGSGE